MANTNNATTTKPTKAHLLQEDVLLAEQALVVGDGGAELMVQVPDPPALEGVEHHPTQPSGGWGWPFGSAPGWGWPWGNNQGGW